MYKIETFKLCLRWWLLFYYYFGREIMIFKFIQSKMCCYWCVQSHSVWDTPTIMSSHRLFSKKKRTSDQSFITSLNWISWPLSWLILFSVNYFFFTVPADEYPLWIVNFAASQHSCSYVALMDLLVYKSFFLKIHNHAQLWPLL